MTDVTIPSIEKEKENTKEILTFFRCEVSPVLIFKINDIITF